MQIPPNLDRAELENYRLQMEQILNRLTCEAEAWAASGTHKQGELPLKRAVAFNRTSRRVDTRHTLRPPSKKALAIQK